MKLKMYNTLGELLLDNTIHYYTAKVTLDKQNNTIIPTINIL